MGSRNYGIDLLRIISMYMVVILHILGQGGILSNLEVFSINYNLAWLLEISCFCCVNCYALITGYVMSNSKFKYVKIFYLWTDVLFWSLILTMIMTFINPNIVEKMDILRSFFNVTFSTYWYFSSYFALFFFIPFINKFIAMIDKEVYKRLIITIVTLISFISLWNDTFKVNNGYSFLWLLSLYFIGAYIKKFNIKEKVRKLYILIGIVLSILLTWCSKLLFMKFNFSNPDILINYNSFTILFVSIGLLLLFVDLKISNKYIKFFISKLASVTFGVYLIHVHPVVWRGIIKDLFKFLIEYNAITMVLLILFWAFILYIICSFLEMFRKFIFVKLKFYKLVDIIFDFYRELLMNFKLL